MLLNTKFNDDKKAEFFINEVLQHRQKINNSKLLTDYINSYNYYKRELLEKVKFSFPKFSILLGQYLLGILLHEGNYSYYSFRTNNTGSIYIHLGGPQKYAKLNKNKSII